MMQVVLVMNQGITIEYFAERLQGLDEMFRYDEPDIYEEYERLGWAVEREDELSVGASDIRCTIDLSPAEEDLEDLELVLQTLPIQQPRFYVVVYRDVEFLVKVLERVADRDDIWVDYGLGEYMVGTELVAKLRSGWRWRLPMPPIDIAVRVPRP